MQQFLMSTKSSEADDDDVDVDVDADQRLPQELFQHPLCWVFGSN